MIRDIVDKIINFISNVFMAFSCLAFFVLGSVTCVDVVGRYFFNSPVEGGIEIIEMLLVTTFFTVFPIVTYQKHHIVINLLDTRLSDSAKHIIDLFTQFLNLVVVFVIITSLYKIEAKLLRHHTVSEYLEIPKVYIIWIAQSGLYVTAALLIVLMIKTITYGSTTDLDEDFTY